MEAGFDIIEAIKERSSVRTYVEQSISEGQRKVISEYISTLDNPFGVGDIRIPIADKLQLKPNEKLGTYGVIRGAKTFLGLICPDSSEGLLAAGYEFEQLILFITSLGLGTVWLGATFSRKNFAKVMNIPAKSLFPAVTPVGVAAKRSLVEKVMRRFAKSDTRKPWDEIFFKNDFSTPLSIWEAGSYDEALEMVRLAPSASNTQPWRIVKIGNDYHFYAAIKHKKTTEMKGDSMSRVLTNMLIFRYIDMGIALCHFHLSAKARNLKGEFVNDAPSLPSLPEGYRYIRTWRPG